MTDSESQAIHRQEWRFVRSIATPAEFEVLTMRIEGYSYPEISARLRNHPHPDALRRRWFRLRHKIAKALMSGGR